MLGKKNFTGDTLSAILGDAKLSLKDYDVFIFPQVYGSTCMGYPGIGGSVMTEGTCVVVRMNDTNEVAVYPGGVACGYIIKNPKGRFWEDLETHRLHPAYEEKLLSEYGEVTYLYGKEKEK